MIENKVGKYPPYKLNQITTNPKQNNNISNMINKDYLCLMCNKAGY